MPRKTFNVLLIATEEGFRAHFRFVMPWALNNFAKRLLPAFGIDEKVVFDIDELDLNLLEVGADELDGNIDLIIFDLMPGSIPDVLSACERLPEALRQKTIGFGDRELLDLFEESRNRWQLPIFSTAAHLEPPRQNDFLLAKILYGEQVELKEA